MTPVLADTGSVVAFLHEGDEHHDWAVEQFRRLPLPFITCEAVIVEAAFLLRQRTRSPRAHERLLGLIARGALAVDFDLEGEADQVSALMTRYSTVPMDLADACLVRMVSRRPEAAVLTLDSDFYIYRKNQREVIPVIMP